MFRFERLSRFTMTARIKRTSIRMIWSSSSTRHSRSSFGDISGKVRSDDTTDLDNADEVLFETFNFFGMSLSHLEDEVGCQKAPLEDFQQIIIAHGWTLIRAPWLSWLQRPTVIPLASEGREFEPHWGSLFLSLFLFRFYLFQSCLLNSIFLSCSANSMNATD